jgi:membrane protein required for colicin V production
MNYIDVLILIILIIAAVRGFANGLVREIASLAALVLGIWGAIKFSNFTAGKLYDYFDMTGRYVGIVAFIVTFIVIVIVIHFIGLIGDKIMEAVSFGFFNRLLGIVFSVFKTVLVLSVIFVVLNSIDSKHHFLPREKIDSSNLYKPIADIVPAIFPVIGEGRPSDSLDRFKKKPDGISI